MNVPAAPATPAATPATPATPGGGGAGGGTPAAPKAAGAPAAPKTPGAPAGPAPPDPSKTPATTPADTEVATDAKLDGKGGKVQAAVNPQQRADLLREAAGKFLGDHVAGDRVSGDKYVTIHEGRERVRLPRLGIALADMVRRAFVAPPEWSRVRAEEHGKRIVILRADPNRGKCAAAIRLLQSPADRPIFHLDRAIQLATLAATLESAARTAGALPRGAGFLLQEPLAWDAVGGNVLQHVEAALEEIDGRLVVTLDSSAALADQDVAGHVVDLGTAPPVADIFDRHLAWRLDDPRLYARVKVDVEVVALSEEVLTEDVPMHVAANLATMVGQAIDGATIDIGRVRQRMSQVATEEFDIWFGGLPDLPARCLAIALAVLDGMPYENVVHAADLLTERLDGPPQVAGDNVLAPWRDPFRHTRTEVLRRLRAETRPGVERGMFGTVPVEAMGYRSEDFPRLVLEHVWRRFGLHRELLGWLHDLSSDLNEEIRARAGTALGLVSTFAFDFVWTQVLRAMAQDTGNFRNREVVAYALRVPAAEPALRPLVDAIVTGLAGNADLPFGQATAARVYGVSLGPLGVGEALAALDRLAVIDDRYIAAGIGDSLADLIMQDETRNPAQVLAKVSAWQSDRRRALVGEAVFLHLARWLTTDHVVAGRTVVWPTLLWFADERIELRAGLLSMWRFVLNSGSLPEQVAEVLAHWADLAEADAHVRTSLSRMLGATAGASERTYTLVQRQVRDWRAPDNLRPKPRTAYAVEDSMRPRNDAA
ncbi:hypothetical protein [Actinoplanes sp. NPDC049265]|uniref:hypothetical protein n=1 Tax=Actinoplanes sp. NPDC049265 TaxID=3363902 RepID=UPI003721A3E5